MIGKAQVFVSRTKPAEIADDPSEGGEHRLWVLAQLSASTNVRSYVSRAWINCNAANGVVGGYEAIGYRSTDGSGESVGKFKIEWPDNSAATIRRKVCP